MDGHNDEYQTGMYGCHGVTPGGTLYFADGPKPFTSEEKAEIEKETDDYMKQRRIRLKNEMRKRSVDLTDEQKQGIEELRRFMFGKG